MSIDRKRLLALFRELLDQAPDDRVAWLDRHCHGEPHLRGRLEVLLAADADEDPALDQPLSLRDEDADHLLADPLIDSQLGPFLILERIGRGGMGTVYRGRRTDAGFDQDVAVKLIRRGLDSDDILMRFLRERRILARLDHPNLARLIDGGISPDGRPWFAMEYIDGQPITAWCDQRRLGLEQRIALFVDACNAVQHAHTHLVVHRDLKPGNILVDRDGRVRLLDFGIAKLVSNDADHTRIGDTPLMTPAYAAPEQFGGGVVDVTCDVYALGVIAFELIAGTLPYRLDDRDWQTARDTIRDSVPDRLLQALSRPGGDGDDALEQRLSQRSTSLGQYRKQVRGDLERIIGTALAKEPHRRYRTVQALVDDLHRYLADLPVTVTGDDWRYRAGKFLSRNRLGVALGAIATLALLAGIAGISWQWHEAREQAILAQAEARRANAVRDYLSLMFRQARELSSDDGELTARQVLDSSAGRIEQEFADDPDTRQTVLAALAELYIHLQDYSGARPLLQRFVALEDGGSPMEVRIRALDDLAVAELRLGNVQAALATADEALALTSGLSRTTANPLLSRVLVTRGQVLRLLGRSGEAIDDLERALALTASPSGEHTRQAAVTRNSLALAYLFAGRRQEALTQFERSLDEFEALGMANSSDVINVLNNIGSLAMLSGRLDQAEAAFERAIALRESVSGPSAGLGAALSNHARALMLRNQLQRSAQQLSRARELTIQYTASDSIDLAAIELALADLAMLQNDFDRGHGHATAAGEVFRRRLGDDHHFSLRADLAGFEAELRRDPAGVDVARLDRTIDLLAGTGTGASHYLAQALCLRAEARLIRFADARIEPGDAELANAVDDAEQCRDLREQLADPGTWPLAHASLLLAEAARHRIGADGRRAHDQALRDLAATTASNHPWLRWSRQRLPP